MENVAILAGYHGDLKLRGWEPQCHFQCKRAARAVLEEGGRSLQERGEEEKEGT